jgi:hypothetical protein
MNSIEIKSSSRKAIVLWELGKHDILVALVSTEDVHCWLYCIAAQGTEGCDLRISKHLVAEGSTFVAGATDGSRTLVMLDHNISACIVGSTWGFSEALSTSIGLLRDDKTSRSNIIC